MIFLYLYFRFGDIGVASYCVNVTDSLCVNIVPFLTLLIIFYAFRVTTLIDFGELKGGVVGGDGAGLGGIGGGLFGGLDGIFGGVTGIIEISNISLYLIIYAYMKWLAATYFYYFQAEVEDIMRQLRVDTMLLAQAITTPKVNILYDTKLINRYSSL